jgi:hypothetical protein
MLTSRIGIAFRKRGTAYLTRGQRLPNDVDRKAENVRRELAHGVG